MKKVYRLHFAIVLILDIVSALSARYSFENDSTLFLILSMASLTTAGYFFIKLMQEEVGIVVNITWVALGTINVTVASWLVFGEKITWFQGLAMATIVAGLTMMEYYAADEKPNQTANDGTVAAKMGSVERTSVMKISSVEVSSKAETVKNS